jgi:hypothetical protein
MSYNNEKTEIIQKNKYEKFNNEYEIIKETHINNMIIITYINNNKKNEVDSNVGITAAITAKARIKIHKGYKDVIKNNGRILYSDTDSIFAAYKKNVDNQYHGDIY